jgi:rod shape-determining protein MreD
MSSSIYLALPLLALLAIFQANLLPHFPILGVVPQLFFLAALAWGMLHGLIEGLVWAFVAGIFVDLFSATPLGVTALASMAAVTVALLVKDVLPENRIIVPALVAALATLIFWLIYSTLLRLLMPLMINNLPFLGLTDLAQGVRTPGLLVSIAAGYGLSRNYLALMLQTAFAHALLVLPIYWGFYSLGRLTKRGQLQA